MTFWKGFKKGMQYFGHGISGIVNALLLAMVYVVGVGLTAIFAKISGKKFFPLGLESRQSYWEELNMGTRKREEYHRQF